MDHLLLLQPAPAGKIQLLLKEQTATRPLFKPAFVIRHLVII